MCRVGKTSIKLFQFDQTCFTANHQYKLFSFPVYPREPCPVHQVFCGAGVPVSIPDSSPPGKHHRLHASLASGDPQVWQEDQLLRWHVDVPATHLVHAVCRLCPHGVLRTEFPWWNGHLLCLPVAMVRNWYSVLYKKISGSFFPPSLCLAGPCCQMSSMKRR